MNKGDYTVHWSGKVCRVDEIAEMDFTGAKRADREDRGRAASRAFKGSG